MKGSPGQHDGAGRRTSISLRRLWRNPWFGHDRHSRRVDADFSARIRFQIIGMDLGPFPAIYINVVP